MILWTVAHQAPLPWGFSRQEYWSGLPCPLGDLPNSGIKLGFPALQVNSLPFEPPGKPKNTGVGSLSLLQGNLLTQELNWGLLHCRWGLYQWSYCVCVCIYMCTPLQYSWASLVAQTVKNLSAMQETRVQSLGLEDPLEKGKATHSSVLAWRIPWTEEPGRLQFLGLQSWT